MRSLRGIERLFYRPLMPRIWDNDWKCFAHVTARAAVPLILASATTQVPRQRQQSPVRGQPHRVGRPSAPTTHPNAVARQPQRRAPKAYGTQAAGTPGWSAALRKPSAIVECRLSAFGRDGNCGSVAYPVARINFVVTGPGAGQLSQPDLCCRTALSRCGLAIYLGPCCLGRREPEGAAEKYRRKKIAVPELNWSFLNKRAGHRDIIDLRQQSPRRAAINDRRGVVPPSRDRAVEAAS